MMLQRQIMFKQLQELQRQQQLQELGDARQQNFTIEPSTANKQTSGGQFPPLINGTPVHGASQVFKAGNMNLVQRGSSSVQGFPNGLVFSQAQSQNLHSMGLVPQQLDVSLYGNPIASAGNDFNQCSPLQETSYEYANMFTKGNSNQLEKPIMQSSSTMDSFVDNQCNNSSVQLFQEKNSFLQVPIQGLSSGVMPGNLQHMNSVQSNASMQEYGRRQEQAVWPGLFPGKTTNVGPSAGLASLDPLEQKILFNTDDNSWEASFGKRTDTSTRDFENTLETADYMSAFPSIQSGSWSALMQSAVAEASSSDTGLQEEWSGLSFQNPELSTDNQARNFMDSGKQQNNWVDNSFQSASSLSSKPEVLFNNSNISSSSHGFQQSGIQYSVKPREEVPSGSSHESSQQSPKSTSKWLDRNPQQKQAVEGSQSVHTLPPLPNAWPGQSYEHLESDPHEMTTSSCANGSQPFTNPTGRNVESLSPSGTGVLNFCNSTANKYCAGDINGAPNKDFSNTWKTGGNRVAGSFSDSVSRLEPLKYGDINTVVDTEHSQLNNFTSVRKSSMTKFDQRVDHESRLSGENCFQRENSNDSYHSHTSQHTITGHEGRENIWLHGSDSRPVSQANQKPLGQVLSQQVPQGLSGYEQGYVGQFEFVGNVSSGMEFGKGHLPGQINTRAPQELPRTSNMGAVSAFFDRSAGFHGSNANVLKSQNMLELLNKVDRSREHGTGAPFDSTSLSPDACAPQPCNVSSGSPCFSLGLGPPSQKLPKLDRFDASQSSPQTYMQGNSSATYPLCPPYVRSRLQNQDCQSPQSTLPGTASRYLDLNDAASRNTSHLIHTYPYDQQFPIVEAMPVTQPSVTSESHVRFSMRPPNVWTNTPTQQHLSGTEPRSLLHSPDSANSGMETASGAPRELHDQNSFKGGNNSLQIYARSRDSPGSDYGKEQSGKERSHQLISSEALDPVSQTGRLMIGQESAASGSLMTAFHPQGLARARHSDNQAPAISAKDLEAFGNFLGPSNVHHQNYSLLHQQLSMKNVDTDPSKRVLVRDLVNSELNVVSQLNQFPTGNNRMLSFSSEARGDQSVQVPTQTLHRDTPQEMVKFGQNDSQSPINSNMSSTGIEHSNMAPSWFKQYGTLKNGQVLPMYDAMSARNAAQQFYLGKPLQDLQMKSSMVQVNSACANRISSVWPATATTSVAAEHLSPNYELPSDVTSNTLAILRPKKRKIAVYELLPWHKEVTQGSQRPLSISMAELEWAQAANRLVEKVEDEAEIIEHIESMLRPKKRLIMTTQLMQQLFRPAPAVILSADATSNYGNMAYYAARLGLGDACTLTSDSQKASDTYDMSSEKAKTSEGTREQNFSKTVEDFISRAKWLEDDLSRLDKRASILDIRVESQELEKVSVINRFVKFHSRPGPAGAAETPSSSGATSTALKIFPQRYVTALPMPRTLPEETHCFPL
ncbi:unnamed protein product [Ilex paraguariensis]|uniref:Uncharacterized protein n=1 Tax=Ilex paraguariensis TaxID=185542 RepID=A0ABC8UY45_9AQUA